MIELFIANYLIKESFVTVGMLLACLFVVALFVMMVLILDKLKGGR